MIKVVYFGADQPTTINVDLISDSTTITYAYDYNCICDYDITKYIEDESLKSVRSGWYNPRKVLIPAKPLINNIKLVIRTNLPIKIREEV